MPGVAAQPLESFLDQVAESTPAPGGGSSAACTAALAAALVEMAARLAHGSDAASRASTLRRRALELAEEELSSYGPVLDATRLPRDDPGRAERLDAALLEASRPPLAIAEAAADVAELGLAAAGASSPSVRGDALAGTLLAEAAAAAAARLVEINLAERAQGDLLDRVRAARDRAAAARRGAEALD